MSNDEESLSIVRDLCSDALDGKITLEEFYRRWPKKTDTSQLFCQIYDDIEEGIQHAPGYILKKGINYEAWRRSYSYLVLYLDAALLGSNISLEKVSEHREAILQGEPQSVNDVDELLARQMGRSKDAPS